MRIGRFLTVKQLPDTSSSKACWQILNNQGVVLGTVEWHGGGRQYVFAPAENKEFNAQCLLDIAVFLKEPEKQKPETAKAGGDKA